MSKTFAGIVFGLSLVSITLPATAQDPAGDDQNEVVCKREKKVNSRFTTKTCFTRAQWAAMAEQNKRDYAATRDRPNIDIRRPQ